MNRLSGWGKREEKERGENKNKKTLVCIFVLFPIAEPVHRLFLLDRASSYLDHLLRSPIVGGALHYDHYEVKRAT